MEVKASLKYLRISPRKVRLVADLIRGLPLREAEAQLKFLNKKAAPEMAKLLQSAKSNAEHNFHLNPDNLYVSQCYVNEGPTAMRWMPRAQGRATKIRKRSSHVYIILQEKNGRINKQVVSEAPSSGEIDKSAIVKSSLSPHEEKMSKFTKDKGKPKYNKKTFNKKVVPHGRFFRRKAI